MPTKAATSSLVAAHRGANASSSASSAAGASDLDAGPHRSAFSATLHAAAAATAANDGHGHRAGGDNDSDDDGENSNDGNDSSETDPLLEAAGADGVEMTSAVSRQAVWPLLHLVRRLILNTIDTALSWNELTSPDLNFAIVRPLAHRLSRQKSIAIVYVLLLNKIQFSNDADKDLAYQQVNSTRAMLCELLAIKMLRTFSRDGIELVTALTAPFSPLAGADEGALTDLFLTNTKDKSASSPSLSFASKVAAFFGSSHQPRKPRQRHHHHFHHHRRRHRDGIKALSDSAKSSALELAILGRATKFLASPLARRCVDGIWTGRVVISSHASHAIIADSYKKKPLSIYDPSKAPVLDHYRLRVPLIRRRLEFLNFLILLVLFLIALQQRGTTTWTVPETVFTIWLAGFALDEFAQMQEHGLGVYFTSLDNGLDAFFILISAFFLGFRISGLRHADFARQELAFDCLSLGAILLCPRVASIFVADSVVLLSLKAMLADFCFFMCLAMTCFSGFWFTFWSLAEDRKLWTPGNIAWLMLRILFFAGVVEYDMAQKFSPLFGPPLFVIFAVAANVMLLTMLISTLSNTFTVVAMRADEEVAYQHACRSMAGISSDALFSYIPPLNLVGFAIILPCKFILTERYLHKTHVFLVRALSFPVLLTIRLLERQSFKHGLELTADRGRRAFSWVPLIGTSRSREERALLEMVFRHEPSALTADANAYGSALAGEQGQGQGQGQGSRISTGSSIRQVDDVEDEDGDAGNGGKDGGGVAPADGNTGEGYLDKVFDQVVQGADGRDQLVAALKERAKEGGAIAGDAQANGEEDSSTLRPGTESAQGTGEASTAEGTSAEQRRSVYGQHLTPDLPQTEAAASSIREGDANANAAASASSSKVVAESSQGDTTHNAFRPRTRTRTTTGGSSVRGSARGAGSGAKSSSSSAAVAALDAAAAAEEGGAPPTALGSSTPPPRGLGSLTSPLARFFGGGAGAGPGTGGGAQGAGRPALPAPQPPPSPSSRRAKRSAEPPLADVLDEAEAEPAPSSPTPPPPARARVDPSSSLSSPLPSSASARGAAGRDGAPTTAFASNTFNASQATPHHAAPQPASAPAPTPTAGPAHPATHGLDDSPAARALLKRMDKLEKSNEAMLELLRSLVAAASSRD